MDFHPSHKRSSRLLSMLVLLTASCLIAAACGSDATQSPTPTPSAFTVQKALVEFPGHMSFLALTSATCPTTLGAVVSLTGPADQTLTQSYTYKWERSDGTVDGPQTRTVPVSSGSGPYQDTYTYQVPIPATQTGWVQLHITAPNDMTSSRVTWDVSCK